MFPFGLWTKQAGRFDNRQCPLPSSDKHANRSVYGLMDEQINHFGFLNE